MSDFFNKMKNYLDRGVEVSKDALVKAGEKVQDFGDKSVNRIEISQLEGKVQKEILKLGNFAYDSFAKENCENIAAENETVQQILKEIASLNEEIAQKKALLKEKDEPEQDEKSEVAATEDAAGGETSEEAEE